MFGFSLTKWHLDVVTETGDAAICYAAQVSLGFVKFQGCAVLAFPAQGAAEKERFTTKSCPEPQLRGGAYHWSAPELGVSGVWTPEPASAASTTPPAPRHLGHSTGKSVIYQPLAHHARVTLQLPEGRALTGFGYGEKLTLTTPPWKLPIRKIHWGRFHSAVESIIWVRWEGGDPYTLVLRNGEAVAGAHVNEESIEGPGWRLPVVRSQGRVLRQGAIGEEAIRQVPAAVRGLLPSGALMVRETKWLIPTRGEGLQGEGGWALCECLELGA